MARESLLAVLPDNCLWLLCQAIKAAGGTAGDSAIDADLDDYIDSQDSNIAERLVLDQLGVYNGDPNSFPDFFAAFIGALDALLSRFNWQDNGVQASSPTNNSWDGRTKLGAMVRHLGNEFSGHVILKQE